MEPSRGIKALALDEDGVTTIEYVFIALLIAMAVVATVTALGVNLASAYDYIQAAFPAL